MDNMTVLRFWVAMVLVFAAFCCIYVHLWVNNESLRQQPRALKVGGVELSMPRLGIVLPLSAEEMAPALESLMRWPLKCSGTSLKSVDVIFYFAQEVPHDFRSHLEKATYSTSCFNKTRVVSAALRSEETSVEVIRSAQFYKLFLAPEVRAHFADYDALTIMAWDMIIAKENSFEMLHSRVFSAREPFWTMGGRLAGICSDKNFEPEKHIFQYHLDGNAVYNNTDQEFIQFVNFTLNRWNFTRSYDEALWATISEFPYSWPMWQRYSSRFVETLMVSAVNILDGRNEESISPVAPEALFYRVCPKHVQKTLNSFVLHSHGCHEACFNEENFVGGASISTLCDPKCVDGHLGDRFRFNGHNCGAGNVSKYGESCRLCFNDQAAALDADKVLAASENAWAPHAHVIMCETKRPPEAIDCSHECRSSSFTICDSRCGSGRYGDWHCNWRGLGEKCRFCFHDIVEARKEDNASRKAGGRVIMCDTHEPPPTQRAMERLGGTANNFHDLERDSVELRPMSGSDPNEPSYRENPAAMPFVGDILYGNICVFIPGYFEFFHETRLAVDTILDFMPGVMVVIATHPMDYHVFNRNLGEPNAAVSIVNDTRVAYASLVADKACDNETRLIYYIEPGVVISRPFTAKDTHSLRGELIVMHLDSGVAGGEHARRSMGTAALLGFHGLSFTYGTDLILPAEINAQLRQELRMVMSEPTPREKNGHYPQAKCSGTCEFHDFLDSRSSHLIANASIFIPELLAAKLYLRSPMGVKFVDQREQINPHFEISTIWDAPFEKPRFGCSIDLSLSLQGYDIADQLATYVQIFRDGGRCDRGFVPVDVSAAKLKAGVEFPAGHPTSLMPPLRDFRISLMYRTFLGDIEIFKVSLLSAIKYIPQAAEIVVVVIEADKDVFEQLLTSYRESAPFPLRVFTEPSLMDGHIQQKYSKMRGDLYTVGDYILHLDSDVLVLHEVTYDDIFHLGKPVLPFRRYRDDSPSGLELTSCWKNGTSLATQEDVLHEFSIFNTHVYPREMYPALREFVEKLHGKSFRDFMSTHVGKCSSPVDLATWPEDRRNSLLSDFNLMGAFMWYHMRDAVYWMATDPYDFQPDLWRIDPMKYQWVCQANGRSIPKDEEGKEQFREDFMRVTSTQQCDFVVQHWAKDGMKNPEKREPVPWSRCQCGWN